MSEQKKSRIKFNFTYWIITFIALLSSIPILTMIEQQNLAKVVGISTVVLTTFAIRRWLYFANKSKGKPNKINLNINDRYWLIENIEFYKFLSKTDKKVFEDRISLFVTDIIITEIGKEVPSRDVCLYVASSAVITFWGLPYWNYGRLSEVLVYPNNFTHENQIDSRGEVMSKVHQGGLMDTTMILSMPALVAGFKNSNDKKNVGIHEFAHLIDKADGIIDGIPVNLEVETRDKWIELFSKEFTEIRNKSNDINSYGATNLPEFFAVVIEYFKESPSRLEQNHKKLFDLLSDYFNVRPSDNN
jgi:Mlc titration factor MtfA (ptsG expression regulator)